MVLYVDFATRDIIYVSEKEELPVISAEVKVVKPDGLYLPSDIQISSEYQLVDNCVRPRSFTRTTEELERFNLLRVKMHMLEQATSRLQSIRNKSMSYIPFNDYVRMDRFSQALAVVAGAMDENSAYWVADLAEIKGVDAKTMAQIIVNEESEVMHLLRKSEYAYQKIVYQIQVASNASEVAMISQSIWKELVRDE